MHLWTLHGSGLKKLNVIILWLSLWLCYTVIMAFAEHYTDSYYKSYNITTDKCRYYNTLGVEQNLKTVHLEK